MINVLVKKKDDDFISISLKGHANFDDYGKDIVCASVSVLVINTINSIEKFTDDKIEIIKDERKGIIDANLLNVKSKDSNILLKSMIFGLKEIEKQYGKNYIKINIQEV